MSKVWYNFFECNAASRDKFEKDIIAWLVQSGIEMCGLDHDPERGMGILFFHEFSDRLCTFIEDIGRNGMCRVLGLADSCTALERDNPWKLLQAGISDVFALDSVADCAEKILSRFKRWFAVEQLTESPVVKEAIIGQSPAWRAVLRQVVEVAHFTDSSMLITGETGTGKELIARLIHTVDSRQDKSDLVILDCTTLVPELSGSEFYGHERGAFTGAITSRDGAFALANNGTLFLDEVGELPLTLQAKLLRVVQEKTFKRVGGNAWQSTNFRLLCATNKDLISAVRHGEFRSDLYYRIANWTCTLPSLRDRSEDILPLARYFIRQLTTGGDAPELDKLVRECLLTRKYPGNVRDLKQLISRIMCRYAGHGPITVGDIPEAERPHEDEAVQHWSNGQLEKAVRQALMFNAGLKDIRRAAETIAINLAVQEEKGNLQRAARRLGVTDRALQLRRAADKQRANREGRPAMD
jgi:transcriptional regulator with GAF, ATPase, and Fis domain